MFIFDQYFSNSDMEISIDFYYARAAEVDRYDQFGFDVRVAVDLIFLFT
jgi:hypothetical protein